MSPLETKGFTVNHLANSSANLTRSIPASRVNYAKCEDSNVTPNKRNGDHGRKTGRHLRPVHILVIPFTRYIERYHISMMACRLQNGGISTISMLFGLQIAMLHD